MKKTDLINVCVEKLAEQDVKVTKGNMAKIVDAVFDSIKSSLVEGEEVKLSGFGNFSVVEKDERIARNPQDGTTLTIPAHRAPKFKYSNSVKELVR